MGTAYLWVSPKLGLPVKTEQKTGNRTTTVELKNIKEGKVPGSLFEAPNLDYSYSPARRREAQHPRRI